VCGEVWILWIDVEISWNQQEAGWLVDGDGRKNVLFLCDVLSLFHPSFLRILVVLVDLIFLFVVFLVFQVGLPLTHGSEGSLLSGPVIDRLHL
jgi:hypothetical protein